MNSPNDTQLLQQLQVELAQKEAALGQKDSLCKGQAAKIDALVQQMVEMEDNLNHSYNQTLESLYASMVQVREEKEYLAQQVERLESQMKAAKEEQEKIHHQALPPAEDSEEINALRRTLSVMEKRLESSEQQMRLLQGSAQNAQDEKRQDRKRVLALQAETLKLKYLLKDKTNALVVAQMRSDKKAQTACAEWPFLNSSEEHRTRIAELESRLGVSTQLADFLRKNLQKAEEKFDRYKEQKAKMSAELGTLQRELSEKAAQLNMSNETSANHVSEIQDLVQKLQDAEKSLDANQRDCESKLQQAAEVARSGQNELLHKIMQLQFQLTESRRYAEFIQSSWNKLKIEKEANEAKSSATIANLEFKLKEASRVSQFIQQTLEKKTNELKQRELSALGEKKQLEFKVAEASRMTVFLHKKLQGVEKKSSEDIANLQFRLTEATRMAHFLTNNANRVAESMQKQRDEIVSLQEQLEATRGQLAAAKSALDAKDGLLDSHGATITALQEQVVELQSRLYVSNQLSDFLKMHLSKAEEMLNLAETQRDDVEMQLSQRKMKMYSDLRSEPFVEEMTDTTKSFSESDHDSMDDSDHTQETNESVDKVADLEFRLTESQRLFHFVQSKLRTLETENHQQAAQYEAKIAQLEFKATESSRIAMFAQSVLSKADQEKKSIESKRTEEKVNLMFSLSEANRMITFLSNKLKDIESKYEGRVKDLELQVADSNRISQCQEFVLKRIVEKKQRLPNKMSGLEDVSSARNSYASDGFHNKPNPESQVIQMKEK